MSVRLPRPLPDGVDARAAGLVERAVAVVDFDEMRLVGLFGHPKPGGYERAWRLRYLAQGARIVMREA